MALTQEDETYFRDMEEMFGSKGWRKLVEETNKMIYQLQAEGLERATDWGDLCDRRGQAKGLAFFVNLQGDTLALKANLEAQDDALL